jgi:hypothetical protein
VCEAVLAQSDSPNELARVRQRVGLTDDDGDMFAVDIRCVCARVTCVTCSCSAHVLTTGFWPLSAVNLCNLPPGACCVCVEIATCDACARVDVVAASKLFKKFYLDNHSGRRLTYQTNMGARSVCARRISATLIGTADVKMLIERKRHELSVSTYQMALLVRDRHRASVSPVHSLV